MQVQDRIQELLAPPPTCESSGAHGPQCPWSELLATFQLHLVCQLLPDGQQRTGSVGWAGQQLLKPGPFFLKKLLSLGCAHSAKLHWPGLAGHPAVDTESPSQSGTFYQETYLCGP